MKKYFNPEYEKVALSSEDVLTASIISVIFGDKAKELGYGLEEHKEYNADGTTQSTGVAHTTIGYILFGDTSGLGI